MANKSLQLFDVETFEGIDQLKAALRENFEALRIIIDGLTGERLEDWTPVSRDGSVSMINDLTIAGGTVKISTDATSVNRAGVRGDKDGLFSYSHDSDTWFKLPVKAGTVGQVLMWPDTGDVPIWSTASGGSTGGSGGGTGGVALDRLTSPTTLYELVLSDDGTNLTLTGSNGDLDIVPAGGNITFNSVYTFPAADGAADQILTTDGAGTLSWDDANDLVSCLTTPTSAWTVCASDDATDITLTFSAGTDVKGLLGAVKIWEFGASNTLLGQGAGDTITTGTGNVVIGLDALGNGGTDPDDAVVVGYQAGYNMTSNKNVGIGYQALLGTAGSFSGADNTGVGYRVGAALTTGSSNCLMGYQAGVALEDGGFNILIGRGCATSMTSGNYNVAIGNTALPDETSGAQSVAIGYRAAFNQVGADYNISIGAESLYLNETGTSNVVVGRRAAYSCGTDADFNVLIGNFSGYNVEGNNSVLIGHLAGFSLAANGSCVMLGYQAGYNETLANKLYIANTNTATPLIGGTFPNTDLTFTTDIVTIDTSPTAGAEALCIKQDDADEPFIKYDGTSAASAANNVSTWTTGNSIQGFVRVDVEGTDYWMPYYDAPTS